MVVQLTADHPVIFIVLCIEFLHLISMHKKAQRKLGLHVRDTRNIVPALGKHFIKYIKH